MTPPLRPHPGSELFRRHRGPQPHRRPSRWWLLATAAGRAALTVGVPAALAVWLMTSPRLRLRTVEVRGAARVEAAWVVAAVGALRGRPLLLVSLAEVEQRLARHPWVAGAAIRKDLPDRLIVEIAERRPAALAMRRVGLYWVDRDGRPIAPCTEAPAAGYLRLAGETERPSWLAASLAAAERLRAGGPAWARDIEEVEVLGPREFAVHAPALPFRVLMSADRLEAAVASLQRYLPEIVERYQGIEAIDLRFARQIVIHFPEA